MRKSKDFDHIVIHPRAGRGRGVHCWHVGSLARAFRFGLSTGSFFSELLYVTAPTGVSVNAYNALTLIPSRDRIHASLCVLGEDAFCASACAETAWLGA